MRKTLLLPALLALATSPAFAQSPAPTPDDDSGVSYDNHGQELLESITVPSIPNAPFSLTLATEWARPQSTATQKLHSRLDFRMMSSYAIRK